MTVPQAVNQRWSLDFASDALACGRRFRVPCALDDLSRACLNGGLFGSLAATRLIIAA